MDWNIFIISCYKERSCYNKIKPALQGIKELCSEFWAKFIKILRGNLKIVVALNVFIIVYKIKQKS